MTRRRYEANLEAAFLFGLCLGAAAMLGWYVAVTRWLVVSA